MTTINVGHNQPINLYLNSNPTTGYTWSVDFDHSFLTLSLQSFIPGAPGLIGSGGQQLFRFIPIRDGNTAIVATYKRSFETAVKDKRMYYVVIAQK
jgi:predicted secreted protein